MLLSSKFIIDLSSSLSAWSLLLLCTTTSFLNWIFLTVSSTLVTEYFRVFFVGLESGNSVNYSLSCGLSTCYLRIVKFLSKETKFVRLVSKTQVLADPRNDLKLIYLNFVLLFRNALPCSGLSTQYMLKTNLVIIKGSDW